MNYSKNRNHAKDKHKLKIAVDTKCGAVFHPSSMMSRFRFVYFIH